MPIRNRHRRAGTSIARTGIVTDRAGAAGLIATLAMSAAGLVVGAAGGYFGDREGGPSVRPRDHAASLDLRDAPLLGASLAFDNRDKMVARSLAQSAPERFEAPAALAAAPKIIIVFDDMGLDRAAFEEIMRLPGPLTLSFLPYAEQPRAMADAARAKGHAVMLHLPMEPSGGADPGPQSLRADMTHEELLATLAANLGRFDGYVGVNNHMGSRLTRDQKAMETILAALDARGLMFLDSLTTGASVAGKAGAAVGAKVYARDVFLDADAGRSAVIAQLRLVERIAQETGFAVAIAHPRADTLAVIGPWLTTAPARGFVLDTVKALPGLEAAWSAPAALALRQ